MQAAAENNPGPTNRLRITSRHVAAVLAGLVLVTFGFPMLWLFMTNDSVQAFVWDWLPWMLIALVWLKVSIGAWVAVQLHDRKVLGDRAIVVGAMSWLVAVALVYGLIAWILASPVFPFHFVAAIAILLVPLARLSAAPNPPRPAQHEAAGLKRGTEH